MTQPSNALRKAMQLSDAGDAPGAERVLVEHLRTAPHDADARLAHAVVLQGLGRAPEAVAAYRLALEARPGDAIAQCNLGSALRELGEFDAAEEVLRAAVAERPEFVPALGNLGLVLCDLDRPEDAAEVLEKAAALNPQAVEVHFALAGAYSAMYRLEEAKASYRRALALRPEFVATRWNLSHLELLTESFREGWDLFESRWAMEPLASRRWSGAQPQWVGQDLRDKTLYVFSEQGFGDTVQFVRYAPLAAERGARVILRVQPELVRLAATLAGVQDVGPTGGALPACDFYCPIMSLPRAFGTTLETIPAAVPYFTFDPNAVAGWRQRLGERDPLRVGLVWSSGIRHYERSIFYAGVAKSMTLAQLAPLGDVRDVAFYSLQKGEPAREAARPPPGMRLVDLAGELGDFADTAALIEALDLLISVDTAAVHVAGALGKPVWNLVKYHACWRWLRGRTDSPWYPTMRLFRQPEPGDWTSVVEEVARALHALAAERRGAAGSARPGLVARLFGRGR
jgi:tetratricopeptide (TPR) repeat protein